MKLFVEEFILEVRASFNARVRTIRSDNGTEYVNQEVEEVFKRHGIRNEKSVAYTLKGICALSSKLPGR